VGLFPGQRQDILAPPPPQRSDPRWGPPSLISSAVGNRDFSPKDKDAESAKLSTHFHLVPRLSIRLCGLVLN
jgi:hypothetical protein